MAFLQSGHMFQNSLRPPAREAHDSQSCAITRGSVPNDKYTCQRFVIFRDSMNVQKKTYYPLLNGIPETRVAGSTAADCSRRLMWQHISPNR